MTVKSMRQMAMDHAKSMSMSRRSLMVMKIQETSDQKHSDDGASVTETVLSSDHGSISPKTRPRAGRRRSMMSRMTSLRRMTSTRRLSITGGGSSTDGPNTRQHQPRKSSVTQEQLIQGMEHASHDLLQQIQEQITSLQQQEQVLQENLRHHLDRAQARHVDGGASQHTVIISMRKYHKLEQEHANVRSALSYLQDLDGQVQAYLDQAKEEATQQSLNTSNHRNHSFAFNLSHYSEFADRVQAILATQPEHGGPSDQELLQELELLMNNASLSSLPSNMAEI